MQLWLMDMCNVCVGRGCSYVMTYWPDGTRDNLRYINIIRLLVGDTGHEMGWDSSGMSGTWVNTSQHNCRCGHHIYVCLSLCVINMCICLCICMSVYVCLFVYLCVCISLFVYLSVWLSFILILISCASRIICQQLYSILLIKFDQSQF